MSEGSHSRVLKTQPAASGGPPKPPKKTARGLEDGSPDPGRLSPEERAELAERLRQSLRKGK
jgi:hypothetical protein